MSRTKGVRWRAEWLWLAVVALLMLLGFWWLPGLGGADSDTYGTGARGKKAYYRLVEELNDGVSRNVDVLVPALESMGTLVLLGPARYPEPWEWEAIYDWLLDGGRLVFAARADSPAVDMGPLDVEIRAVDVDGLDAADSAVEGEEESHDKSVEALASLFRRVEDASCAENVDTVLADGNFCWSSTATIQHQSADVEVLLEVEGKPQVIFMNVGEGVAVVAASDRIFINSELARREYDTDLLAYRILESCDALEPIYFDESLNAKGTPKAFGILFDPLLRRISLQLCLCAVLFGWWGSRRFGCPEPAAEPSHRSIREHAVAMGNLHFKAGSGSEVALHYLEFFRRELGLGAASSGGGVAAGRHSDNSRLAEVLAGWAGMEVSTVSKTLEEADRAQRGERLSSSETGWLIGSLARIKRRISKGKRLNETDYGA